MAQVHHELKYADKWKLSTISFEAHVVQRLSYVNTPRSAGSRMQPRQRIALPPAPPLPRAIVNFAKAAACLGETLCCPGIVCCPGWHCVAPGQCVGSPSIQLEAHSRPLTATLAHPPPPANGRPSLTYVCMCFNMVFCW